MPIITISRGSYSRGKEVAEKVAQKLGYECISREVLVEASNEFNVPEVKLLHAIRDAPSILDHFTFGRDRYIAYIQAALLARFQSDNVVYHGQAGHYFVSNISHTLKVRIIAETEDRVKVVMEREGIPQDKALRVLKEIDEARRKWSRHLYGIDTHDPALYDLVIRVKKLSTDDAAELVCRAAGLDQFQATAASRQALDDLLLASRVRAALIDQYPRGTATAAQGVVRIGLEGTSAGEEKGIRDIVEPIGGVEKIEISFQPFMTPD